MSQRVRSFTKVDLTPRRFHGFALFLFILGTLLPPLAVAARFGIGKDFFINTILTICGYIPGHVHNFYIQNIRNNKNHRRTPKWVQKYGLVDTSEIKRKERRSQWANRYNERLPNSTLAAQPYEEGQEGGSSVDLASEDNAGSRIHHNGSGDFWSRSDEQYYGQNGDNSSVRTGGSGGRWRYPANFDDAVVERPKKSASKKKKVKKDRWARTEDAYSIQEGEGTKRRKSKKKNHSTVGDLETYSRGSSTEFPEDPEGGLYGNGEPVGEASNDRAGGDVDDIFTHEL